VVCPASSDSFAAFLLRICSRRSVVEARRPKQTRSRAREHLEFPRECHTRFRCTSKQNLYFLHLEIRYRTSSPAIHRRFPFLASVTSECPLPRARTFSHLFISNQKGGQINHTRPSNLPHPRHSSGFGRCSNNNSSLQQITVRQIIMLVPERCPNIVPGPIV
jgi:hypothetical protein